MMKKYKKERQGFIPLGDGGFGLIVPEHSDGVEVMVAIGILVQIVAMGDKENGKVSLETMLAMMTEYIKAVYEGDYNKIKEMK